MNVGSGNSPKWRLFCSIIYIILTECKTHNSDISEHLIHQESANTFLRHRRDLYSDCRDKEGYCEADKPGCKVAMSGVLEKYCETTCDPGQTCGGDLSNPCPAHFSVNIICVDINECASNPCRNGGTCSNLSNRYTCDCVTNQFWGTNCELSHCSSSPCLNGATCVPLVGSYHCICDPGYYDTDCQREICRPMPADIIFILDASESDSLFFEDQLNFVVNFANKVIIGPDDFNIGTVSFSFDAQAEFALGQHGNAAALATDVHLIRSQNGTTHLETALRKAGDMLTIEHGARVVRAKQFVICLTEGMSTNSQASIREATSLKSKGVSVFTIGIGTDVLHTELEDISNSASDVFPSEGHDALYKIIAGLVNETCTECHFHAESDIIFLTYTSNDATPVQYHSQLRIIRYITSHLSLGPDGQKVGLLDVSEDPKFFFPLQTYTALKDLQIDINTHLTGTTATAQSFTSTLEFIQNDSFSSVNGGRPNARKFVVIVSDGRWFNETAVIAHAQAINSQDIILATVVAGSESGLEFARGIARNAFYNFYIDETELEEESFETLLTLVSQMEYFICEQDWAN